MVAVGKLEWGTSVLRSANCEGSGQKLVSQLALFDLVDIRKKVWVTTYYGEQRNT
jgi:hypothetical protein